MGFGWKKFLHPDDVEKTDAIWARCFETAEPYVDELRLRRKDGVYRHFLARAVPIRNDAGECERWIGSATDVHDQKLAEAALRKSEKLATAGRLAASIAHEINNPLEATMNTLYLARTTPGVPFEALEYLDLADGELMRIAHITRQSLGFYREFSAATSNSARELIEELRLPAVSFATLPLLTEASSGRVPNPYR